MSDTYNMATRKFLKQVGVTSQAAIEDALRTADTANGQSHNLKITLVSESLGIEHEVTGEIAPDK